MYTKTTAQKFHRDSKQIVILEFNTSILSRISFSTYFQTTLTIVRHS